MERFFAVCQPGIEFILEQECRDAGLQIDSPDNASEINSPVTGGIPLLGDISALFRAHTQLRCTNQILLRLGHFYTGGFPEFKRKAARISWQKFLTPKSLLQIRVSCHKSRLYHSGAIRERLLEVLNRQIGTALHLLPANDNTDNIDNAVNSRRIQRIVVRLVRNHCTISINASGDALLRRGYRLASGKAPLRETLAATLLRYSQWDRRGPLLDPFCGSGTIAIEAARWAAGLPPALADNFAFRQWPIYRKSGYKAAVISPQVIPGKIIASDRDAGAISIGQQNARRADVDHQILFQEQAFSAMAPPGSTSGWVVCNPPYGQRVSRNKDLRNMYAKFGHIVRERCPGWRVALLCPDTRLLRHTGIPFEKGIKVDNGGIQVWMVRGNI